MPASVGSPAASANRFGIPVAEVTPDFPVSTAPPPHTPFVSPAPASYAPAHANAEGSMLSRRAVALVALSIGIGAVGMGVSYALSRNTHMEPATYLRYALMLTLAVYGLVGGLLVTQLVPGVRLRWTDGSPAAGVLLGAGVGGTISALLLAAVSSASGRLSPDPRVVTLMSEGDIGHIAITIGLTCLCAPLIEEILFRGLLLESLRGRGKWAALSLSGLAFAIWHLNPAALKYYALMGMLFGFLYMKRGLVCSMAAHFAFNGVLTVAALAVVLSPGKTYAFNDVSVHAPSGWSQHQDTYRSQGIALEGPSGAAFLVLELPTPSTVTIDSIEGTFRSSAWQQFVPNIDAAIDNVRQVQLPVGAAVEADVTAEGHAGNLVFVPEAGKVVEVVFISAGSDKAKSDFPRMIDSLRVG